MSRSALAQVRDIVPIRPLTRNEALDVAERQARLLLDILQVTAPPVSQQLLADLPRIDVVYKTPWPFSGATQWVNGRWVVVINGAEPARRQRSSLAHELKHILDHPFIHVLYHGVDSAQRADWTEQVCDYFAGCLLVPRHWLKTAWANGHHDLAELADIFQVSPSAVSARVRQTGLLTTPAPKYNDEALRAAIRQVRKSAPYHRTTATTIT